MTPDKRHLEPSDEPFAEAVEADALHLREPRVRGGARHGDAEEPTAEFARRASSDPPVDLATQLGRKVGDQPLSSTARQDEWPVWQVLQHFMQVARFFFLTERLAYSRRDVTHSIILISLGSSMCHHSGNRSRLQVSETGKK